MNFGQFLSVLRARWLAALLVLGVIVLGTVIVVLLLPKQYKATASVVVDFKPDPITAVMFGGMASPAFIATQVDIIQSDRVALRVVRNLKLNENPQIRQQWQDEGSRGSIEQWLSSLFQRQMEVVPSKESSVIAVTYKAPDPRFAAVLANAFVQAYIQTALELKVDPARQYASFFDVRSKQVRETLDKAQAKLSLFQNNNGIVASDERLDVETGRLNELSSQLVSLQAIASESNSRQAQSVTAQGDRLQEVLNNPVIGMLKADISRGEARMQELNTRYGDNHPQVQETKANLTELRSRLEAETRKVTGSVGMTGTINRQREASTRAQLEAQRTKVLRMKAVRDEGLSLMRDVDNAQKAYDTLLARLNQTNLEGQTTQGNVNVLTEADPPLEPSFPRIPLSIAISVVIGALVAIGVALLLEVRDRRIRSVDDITAALGLPVLGMMPSPRSKSLLGRKQDSQMQQRLMAPLPPTGRGA